MENQHVYIIGKSTISMGHLYHGYITINQRVCAHDMHTCNLAESSSLAREELYSCRHPTYPIV